MRGCSLHHQNSPGLNHSVPRRLAIVAGLTIAHALPALSSAQQTRLTFTPARAEPGAIVRLTLRDSASRADSIVAILGVMAGEPLHFSAAAPRVWRAIGGVPIDASGYVTARVIIERSSRVDTVSARVVVPRVRVVTSRLRVDTGFTRPLDSATAERVARENARAREVGRLAHETPRLWTRQFLRPRLSEITSGFGTGRVFNGAVTSRHLGVDFRGGVGDTVRAANRGVVALVDTFFLAGTVVYVDHGAGVVTGYFHLSKPLVTVGDTVSRGQRIALVGQSGRVTGPHLHWTARYGALAVNPLDLLAISR
jgi:murein DD-endopeptidase MepM/ murein hydrolase activator NlpD